MNGLKLIHRENEEHFVSAASLPCFIRIWGRRQHGRIYSGALGKLLLISLPPTNGRAAIKIPCMTAAHAKRGPQPLVMLCVMGQSGEERAELSHISAFYHFYSCRLSDDTLLVQITQYRVVYRDAQKGLFQALRMGRYFCFPLYSCWPQTQLFLRTQTMTFWKPCSDLRAFLSKSNSQPCPTDYRFT